MGELEKLLASRGFAVKTGKKKSKEGSSQSGTLGAFAFTAGGGHVAPSVLGTPPSSEGILLHRVPKGR